MHDGKLVSHGIYTADQLVGLNGSLGGVRSATFVLVRISADRDHDIGGVDHRVVARVKSFDHIYRNFSISEQVFSDILGESYMICRKG